MSLRIVFTFALVVFSQLHVLSSKLLRVLCIFFGSNFSYFKKFLFDLKMSDLEWISEIEGSWSSDHDPINSEVLAKVAKATSANIVPAVVARSHGLVDPKRGST